MTDNDNSATSCPSGLAMMVLDMQPPFIRAMYNGGDLERRCRFAIRAATLLGIPVFFTEQVPDKLGHTAEELLAAAPGATVFAKTTFSALGAEGLPEFLAENGIHHLLIAGLEVPVCIYQTVLACANEDIEVTLLSDCISARRVEDAQTVLRTLAAPDSGCHILPSESIFYSILGAADHPAFRAYTQLVKEA